MKKKLLAALLVVAVFTGLSIAYATACNKNKDDSCYSDSSKNMKTAKKRKTNPECCKKGKDGECKMKGEKISDMKGSGPSEN